MLAWEQRRELLRNRLRTHPLTSITPEEVQAHFQGMPARYWEGGSEGELVWGLEVIHDFFKSLTVPDSVGSVPVVQWRAVPEQGFTKVMICTWDRHGLLAKVASAFSAVRINILQADVYTRADSLVLDVFRVRELEPSHIRDASRLSEMVGLRGRVLPTTREDVWLRAEMESGQFVTGETSIVAKRQRIRRLSLDPSPKPLPDVLRALVNADGIVVGPGSLYTSLIPNLLVEGIASTIYGVNAVRIYVANLMTEPGETDHYTLDDHLRAIRLHAGFDLFDYILVNKRPLETDAITAYAEQGARPVKVVTPLRWAGKAHVVECDLAVEYGEKKIRHQPGSVARAIRALVRAGRSNAEV